MGGRQTGRRRHDLRRSAAHGHRQFVIVGNRINLSAGFRHSLKRLTPHSSRRSISAVFSNDFPDYWFIGAIKISADSQYWNQGQHVNVSWPEPLCVNVLQVRFGEGSGETYGALVEPKLVTANAARSATTLPQTDLRSLRQ